jgi:hypothetical protein
MGARIFLAVFGILCIAAAVRKGTRLGPALRRDRSLSYPATRAQRVVLFVYGVVFLVGSITGWLH